MQDARVGEHRHDEQGARDCIDADGSRPEPTRTTRERSDAAEASGEVGANGEANRGTRQSENSVRVSRDVRLLKKHYPDPIDIMGVIRRVLAPSVIETLLRGLIEVKPLWARMAQYWGWISVDQYDATTSEETLTVQNPFFSLLPGCEPDPKIAAWDAICRRWPLRKAKVKRRMSRYKRRRLERQMMLTLEGERQTRALARKLGIDYDEAYLMRGGY